MDIYKCIESLSFTTIKVVFTPRSTINFDGWIGAHLRNRLLYVMESVPYGDGITLREFITSVSVDESHPLYKELSGGAPKGYSIKVESPLFFAQNYTHPSQLPLVFSVTLVGRLSAASAQVVEALHRLAEAGLNRVSFTCQIASVHNSSVREVLESHIFGSRLDLTIYTPMSLYKLRDKGSGSYQARLNGLPTLYQLVQSSANKLVKLSTLYCGTPWDLSTPTYIEQVCAATVPLSLSRCNIRQLTVTTAPRVSDRGRMKFKGVIGSMSWRGDSSSFGALLAVASHLNLGDDTVYGMGSFSVE